MQIRLLDVLADPDMPTRWPLKLKIIESVERERSRHPPPHKETGLLCKFYCAKEQKYLVTNPLQDDEKTLPKEELNKIAMLEKCLQCMKTEIVNGILYYDIDKKKKWFLVDREIAVMYALDLRDKKQEERFFKKFPTVFEEMNLSWKHP